MPRKLSDKRALGCDNLRVKQEVRSIVRARKLGVPTPVLYLVEHEASAIYMEMVQGCSVKAALHKGKLSEQGDDPQPYKLACVLLPIACIVNVYQICWSIMGLHALISGPVACKPFGRPSKSRAHTLVAGVQNDTPCSGKLGEWWQSCMTVAWFMET